VEEENLNFYQIYANNSQLQQMQKGRYDLEHQFNQVLTY